MISKTLTLAAASLAAITLSACATQPHSDKTMLQGAHFMPPKNGMMSDRSMPARSADCTEKALANMPPDHRAMCEGKKSN